MSYPTDKETWERVDTNDIIVKGDKNNWAIFLEALQDTLGLGIKLGYGTVKLLLDYLKGEADKVTNKLDKRGITESDYMTGNLEMRKDNGEIVLCDTDGTKRLGMLKTAAPAWVRLRAYSDNVLTIEKGDGTPFMIFDFAGGYMDIAENIFFYNNVDFVGDADIKNLILPIDGNGKEVDGGIKYNSATKKVQVYHTAQWNDV